MVIEDQLLLATVCPSQHAEHNELRNHTHTLNVKARKRLSADPHTLTV